METKMSAKIKWAIALLIVRVLSAFAAGGKIASALGVDFDNSYYFVFAALYEQLPTVAAVILIFYNHKQPKTESAGFTTMQKWTFALVWVQHAYVFISYSLADSLSSVWTTILGGCVWLGIITYLLYSAWKNPVAIESEDTPTIEEKDTPLEEDTQEIPPADTEKLTRFDVIFSRMLILLFVVIPLIMVIALVGSC